MVKPFSPKLRNKLEFTYVRLVQERVVEGIKHMEGGSSSFQIYYLQNITEKANEKLIKKQLVDEYDLTPHEVERFLSILSYVKSYRSLMSASIAFIKKYNKGKLPFNKDIAEALELNEEYLMLHTYFGSLVKDLYDISQKVKQLKDIPTSQLKQGLEQNTKSNTDTFDLNDIL